jgi:cation diffusion facilitator CzcD-associated flavoprotein CzcO
VKNLATGETLQDQADVLISGRGNLNTPYWPEIDGLDTFKGEKMHSATWNQEYEIRTALFWETETNLNTAMTSRTSE